MDAGSRQENAAKHETKAYSGGFRSALVQATAVGEIRGSATICLVSTCRHFMHSNVRSSNPPPASVTAVLIIRIWHLGQRGRWVGKSSGSGLGMAVSVAPHFKRPSHGLLRHLRQSPPLEPEKTCRQLP